MLSKLWANENKDKIEKKYPDYIKNRISKMEDEKNEVLAAINILQNAQDGTLSDGYHTFEELYYHRMILFSVICNQNKERSWKSKLHADGTMFENYFIVGITTKEGDYTYHYHMDYWDMFNVNELDTAPEWDGHKPEDLKRLLSLLT